MKRVKPWNEMTEKEIIAIKKDQCVNCQHFSRETSVKNGIAIRHCEYLLNVGHSRGCMPTECMEKGTFEPRTKKRRKRKRPLS